ncbi:phage tail tape measure protein [Herbiconiux sp. YIM B11900]|uniref:phage tail tape measure protein n=1 Tax=Herbiconiux sp. YIM B11900 TaxID=3404131 RepID=UPI003F851FE0
MNTGAIVYQILMQGAAVFKKDTADAEQAVEKLGTKAKESSEKVSKAGDEVDQLGKKAKESKAPLDATAKSEEAIGKKADETKPKVKSLREEIRSLGDDGTKTAVSATDAAKSIGVGLLGIGAAIALVGGMAIGSYANFEQGMSRVAAATMATAEQQKALGESAVQAGADSVFSAREAADAQTELAKAGVSVDDILSGGLTASLALAAAGELDIARAAEIAATTLTVFKLKGEDAGKVSDLLAAGAGKAQGSVDDLALALEYVGPTFARLNVPLDQTVGTLALFASNGILGEKAGTGLRGVISSITAPTAKASETMKQYGINVFDAQGKFIGMQGVAGQLQSALGGLDEETRSAALGAIFGAESANAAGVLYASGSKGVAEWTQKVSDQGYAAEQAWRMTDNLTGDIERLGGAFDSVLIQSGSGANEVLRDMVQLVTGAVDFFGQLPQPLQETTLWVGLGAAGLTLMAGAFLVLFPKVMDVRKQLDVLNETAPRTAAVTRRIAVGLGVATVAFTAAILVVGAFAASQAEATAKAKTYESSLDDVTGAITNTTRAMAADNLQAKGGWWIFENTDSAASAAKKLGLSLDVVTEAALGNKKALEEVRKVTYDPSSTNVDRGDFDAKLKASGLTMSEYIQVNRDLRNGLEAEGVAVEEATTLHADKAKVTKDDTEATEQNAVSTDTAAAAYLAAADASSSLQDQLQQLLDVVNKSNDVGQDAVSSNAAYRSSLEDVQKTIAEAQAGAEGYSTSVDESTAAGAANADMFRGLAADSQAAAEAQFVLDQKTMSSKDATDKYIGALQTGRQELYDQILALTGSADAAQLLTDKVYGIPDAKQVELLASTAAASAAIDQFVAKYNGIKITADLFLDSSGGDKGLAASAARYTGQAYAQLAQADGGKVNFYANGGRENHIAQFARAGTMRVWAEPETGGEYYIPMAPSKRGRSTQILAAAAAEMGYGLAPAGAQSFADGGRAGDTISTVGGDTNVNVEVKVDGNADPYEIGYETGRQTAKRLRGKKA